MPQFTQEHLDYFAELNKKNPRPPVKKKWKIQQPDGSIVQFYGPRDMADEDIDTATKAQAQLNQQKKEQKKFDLADKLFPQTNEGLGKLAAGYSDFMNTPLIPEVQSGEDYFKQAQPAANTMEAVGQGIQGFGRDVYNDAIRPFSSLTGILSAAIPGAGLLSKAARPASTLASKLLPGLMSGAAAPGAAMDVQEFADDPSLATGTRAASSVGSTLLGYALTKGMVEAGPNNPPPVSPNEGRSGAPPPSPPGGLGIPANAGGPVEGQLGQRALPASSMEMAPIRPQALPPGFGQPQLPSGPRLLGGARSPENPPPPSPEMPPPDDMGGLAAPTSPPPPPPGTGVIAPVLPEGLSNTNPEFGMGRINSQILAGRGSPIEPLPEMPIPPPRQVTRSQTPAPQTPLPEMPVVPGVEFAKERQVRNERLQPAVLEQSKGEAAIPEEPRVVERPTTAIPSQSTSLTEGITEKILARKAEPAAPFALPKKVVGPLQGFDNVSYEGQMGGADLYKYGGKEGNNFSVKGGGSQQEFLDAYHKARSGYESRTTAQPKPVVKPAASVKPAEPSVQGAIEPRTVGEHTIEASGDARLPYQLRRGDTIISKGLKPTSFDAFLKRESDYEAQMKAIDKKYADEPDIEGSDVPKGFQEEEVSPPTEAERQAMRPVERPGKPTRKVERASKKKEEFPLARNRPGERGSIRLRGDRGKDEPLRSNLRLAFAPLEKPGLKRTSEVFSILNRGGISQDELKVSGIHEFVRQNPKEFEGGKLQDWLNSHQEVVQEHVYADMTDETKAQLNALRNEQDGIYNEIDALHSQSRGLSVKDTVRDPTLYDKIEQRISDLHNKVAIISQEIDKMGLENDRPPMYTSYTSKGSRRNQKEVMHNFPEEKSTKGLLDEDEHKLRTLKNRSLSRVELSDEDYTELHRLGDLKRAHANELKKLKAQKYVQSMHEYEGGITDSPVDVNRIGQTRQDERVLNTGEDATHINELQSDWVREVRQFGGRTREDLNKLEDIRTRQDSPDIGHAEYLALTQERLALIEKTGGERVTEPHILHKDWIDFSMKRALVDAAEKGSKYLTWSRGEEVADRYSLRKQLDSLEISQGDHIPEDMKSMLEGSWDPDEELKYALIGTKNGNTVVERLIKKKELPSFVGGELAKRLEAGLLAQTEADKVPAGFHGRFSVSGEDLQVGGKWALNQYNAKMVNYMNDLAKKNGWPSRVVDKELTNDGKHIIVDGSGQQAFFTNRSHDVFKNKGEAIRYLEKLKNDLDIGRQHTEATLEMLDDLNQWTVRPLDKDTTVHAFEITPEMAKQIREEKLPTSGDKIYKAPAPKIKDRSGERGSFSFKPAEGISDLTKKRQDLTVAITDVIAGMGKPGKELARLMTRARLVGEHYAGTWEQRTKDILEDISDEEFGHVNKDNKVLKGNVIDVVEGNAEPRSEKIRVAAEAIRDLLDETGVKAEQSGMSLRVGDKNIPFEKRANYFPHLYTEEFWARLKKDLQFKEKILQRMVKQNKGMTLDQAAKALNRARQFGERLIDPQHERVFNLPGWERSKGALYKHLHDMGRQIGNAEELGPKDIAGPKLDRLIKETTDPEYAYELLKRAFKRDEPQTVRDVKIANKITTAASWAYLSRAAIGNLAQLTRIPAHSSFTAAAKAAKQYLTNREGFYRSGLESGSIVEIGAKGLMEEFGSKSRSYSVYGIEQSEKFLRSMASWAGRSDAEATFRVLKKDPTNKAARTHLSDLLQEDAESVLSQKELTPEQSKVAGGRMAERTQGRAEAMDLPKDWSGSPYARMYFLYKKYAFQDTRNMWKAIKENPVKAITTIAVLNQLAGEVVGDVKETLKGLGKGLVTGDITGEIARKVSERGKYLNKDNPEVGRFFDNYLQSWTYGILSDVLQNLKKGEFAGTVGEMAGDAISTAVSSGSRVVEGKKSPLKPVAKTAVGLVPFIGPGLREGMFPKEEPKRKGPPRPVLRQPHRPSMNQ